MVLAAAMLTRYDGWVLAFVIGCAAVAVVAGPARAEPAKPVRGVRRALAASVLLCALTPALWLAHNYAINYKPLDWWNGPYSAKPLKQRSVHGYPYPGKHDLGACGQAVSESCAAEFFQRVSSSGRRRLWRRC